MDADPSVRAIHLELSALDFPDLKAILAYWHAKRGDRFAPRRADIEPQDFVKLLPRIMLIDVDSTGTHFRYRLAGTALRVLHGYEPTGKSPLDFKPLAFGQVLYDHYRECVQTRRPSVYRILLDTTDTARSYVRLLLPLSSDGKRVDMLMTIDDGERDLKLLSAFFQEFAKRPETAPLPWGRFYEAGSGDMA